MSKETSKWDALIEAEGVEDTKVIPTDPKEETDDLEIKKGKWDDVIEDIGVKTIGDVTYDKKYNIDLDNYRDELGSDIFMPEGDNGVDILNHNRAKNQALYDQVGNFLGQAVVGEIIGGTIEGLGYLLDIGSIVDVMQGDEADWGNFMTDFGQSIREGTEEALQIHTDPFAEGWGKMADSGWWFSNAVSVASTLSMLIPTTGAMKALSFLGKGIGASRGMQAVRRAVGMAEEMGTKSRWMTNGISQAVLSRNIENWMEAHGTFEDEKQHLLNSINPETGKAFTEEEATQGASEAAANNWKNGWAMLLQDIPQYMAIGKVFNPVTGKMMNAQSAAAQKGIKAGLKPWQQKGLDIGKTFFGEAGEEAYQFYISERAKLQTDLKLGLIDQKEYDRKMSDALGSEEMLTSAFFGGLGGNVFQMAGPALNRALKSKDRKQYEEQLEKYYGEMVNNNAKQVSLLYHHLNEADQQTSPIQREAVINEMMLNMTAEALEADKFELFLESMDQISGMSEEAVQQYNEQTGSEFNRELAASYAPRIKQKALEMRDRYLKHRNHYNKRTSSALARLELENAQYNEFINKKQKDVNSIRNDINASWENLASKSLKDKLAINEEYAVLTRRKKALAAQLKAETSSVKKSWIEKAINSNESNIKFNRKKRREYDKAKKNLDSVMKELEENKASDNVQAESAYQAHKRQLYDALELEAVAKERILINNEEMNHIKTDEGQKMVKSRILSEKLEEYETIDSLENLKEEVNNSEIAKEDSEELLNKIGEKIAVLKVEEDAAKAKAAKAQSEENARRKNSERNNNPAVVSNQNKTTIIDVVEDEDSEEMPTFDKDQLDESDRAINSKIGSGRLMAVLDKVDGTEAFQDWMEIPVSKVGEVFNYTVSDRSQKLSKAQNDAIQSFENGNITQEVYDNLPIKLTLDGQPKIFSFIPTKPTASDSQEKKNNYKRGYNSQRKIIIDKLAKKEKVFSKVAKNSGGDLVKDFDAETNTVPNNSILDILQIGNNMDNIELRVTDDKGFLMDTNKDYDTRFGKPMMIDEDSNGNKKPYKGGVFLILKKANGEPFALRLNLAKNTDAQSKLLADLLIKIAVPDPVLNDDGTFAKQKNKDGKETIMVSPKELKLTSPISELDQETLSLVKDLMGPEIDMLDKEYKDPTIMSLINSFVYTNDNTEGKTTELFIRGNDLFFGGNRMSPGFKNNSKMRNQLIEFLKNTKKRQFNIKNWSENKAYRKYVIDNQIISTNAATGVNSFINTRKYDKASGKMTGRRIQIFMEPIETPKSSPIVVDDSEIIISNDYIDEDGVAAAITMDENGNLVMANKPFQNELTKQNSEVEAENISSKGSDFAKKLTNPGNNLKVTYKGTEFRNAEHAYQTYKSGEFDQKAYNSTAFKPVGSKLANKNTNYQTMVDILKAKLEQHPKLIEGINKRGGLAYIEQSTHNVTGDRFWESKGQNKFIEALSDAYKSIQPTQQSEIIGPDGKTYNNINSLLEKFPDYYKDIELSASQIEEYKNTIGKIKTYSNLSPQENLKKIIKELLPNRDVNKIMLGVSATDLMQTYPLTNQDVLIGISSFNELKNEKEYDNLDLSSIIKNIVDAIKMKDIVLSSKLTQQISDTQVRKEKEDVVSSKPNVTLINDSQITFESQIEEDTDEDWDDIDMSSTDDLDGMDSGEMTEKCN